MIKQLKSENTKYEKLKAENEEYLLRTKELIKKIEEFRDKMKEDQARHE